MVFLLVLLALLAPASSVNYTLTINCDGSAKQETNYCYLPGITLDDYHYYDLTLLEDNTNLRYEDGRRYAWCDKTSYSLQVHDNKPAIRVTWTCNGTFGIKPKETGFRYQGGCGQNNYGGFKIINGNHAKSCQFPWMTYVKLDWKAYGYGASCGGSLISDRWVLTAAHCVIKEGGNGFVPPPSGMYVRTGSLEKFDGYIQRSLDKIVVHPEYNYQTLRNDIALLRLEKPVVWDHCHAPVCLNSNVSLAESRYLSCIISGWGASGINPTKYPKELRWGYDAILSRYECNQIYGSHSTDYTLCGTSTRNGGQGFCAADSGGPLVCRSKTDGRYYQHGIVSAYQNARSCQMEGLYSNVHSFYSWIREYVK